ncbi:MAG: hypothetical protein Q9171_000258 [Xanthocarpia ochracea]
MLTVISHPGYTINYAYEPTHPEMPAWANPGNKDTGFINPGNFTNPDIICHKDATPGALSATVAAGSTVQLQWSDWPESHHGPVMDYLANCNGDCSSVDKTALKFTKIDEEGLIEYTSMPGRWASDKLLAANNSWTVTIPQNVAPGNYVLRHEIIALHSANNPDGAQNYPQCVNLKITGSGTDELASGTLGTELYKPDDAGIFVNIYEKLTTYAIPGPKLYSGASPSSGTPSTDSGEYASPTSSTTSSSPEETSSTPTYGTIISPSSTSPPISSPPYPTAISNGTSSPTFNPAKQPIVKQQKGQKPADKQSAYDVPTASSSPSSTGTSTPSTTNNQEEEETTPENEPSTPYSPNTTTDEVEEEEATETTPNTNTDTPPSKPTIAKMTTAQLFAWLDLIVAELQSRFGNSDKVTRRHTRDFLPAL